MNKMDTLQNKYWSILQSQCLKYAKKHFYPVPDRSDIDFKEIADEMVALLWRDYRNKNKIGRAIRKIIKKGNNVPNDILDKEFKNALRNKGLLEENDSLSPPTTGIVIKDEDGGIIDYYIPPDDSNEESFVRDMDKAQYKAWVKEIERLEKKGLNPEEIKKILTPLAMKLKYGMAEPEQKQPKETMQMVMF